MLRGINSVSCLAAILLVFDACACGETPIVRDQELPEVAKELEIFATSLTEAVLANKTALSDAIVEYLESHGPDYFGSTVAVLENGKAVYSPYVYHDVKGDLVRTDDLMDPSYKIDEQPWLREPLELGEAVWTEPYFDEGGGNIWMRTRSHPISVSDVVRAVATTDVRVETERIPPSSTGYTPTVWSVFFSVPVALVAFWMKV
eukprot:jgi/Picsp_1/1910/NSC_05376-R1_multi-sensor hybrid histidine kinase